MSPKHVSDDPGQEIHPLLRPKITEEKSEGTSQVNFRLNPKDDRELREAAKKAGMSVAAFVIWKCLGRYIDRTRFK